MVLSMISNFIRANTQETENELPVSKKNYDREHGVSPIFTFSNGGTIAAGAFDLVDFEEQNAATAKYLPFNIVEVTNSSSVKIKIYPNQDRTRGIVVPAGFTKTLTQDTIRFVRSILIENTDGATGVSANEIDFLVQRDTTNVDSLVKDIHRKVIGGNI